MNCCKLIKYDLRFGLLRWRYLFVPIIFLMPCIQGYHMLLGENIQGTWLDYMLYCFKGCVPIGKIESIQNIYFPSTWFTVIGGCLFMNLDYLPRDLMHTGQQLIIRSTKRKDWFVSKCVWNMFSCAVYFCIGCFSVLVFTLCTGGGAFVETDLIATVILLGEGLSLSAQLAIKETVMLAFLLPFLTLVSLSILEMLLSLFLRPVISFIFCISILSLATFGNSPLILGVGAMVIRNNILTKDGVFPCQIVLVTLATIVICIICGIIIFPHKDILNKEE